MKLKMGSEMMSKHHIYSSFFAFIVLIGIGGCSNDGISGEQRKFLDQTLTALNACRVSLCTSPYWDNPNCALAHDNLNTQALKLIPENGDGNSRFEKIISRSIVQLDKHYIFSLENEIGTSREKSRSICRGKAEFRFDALDRL